MNLFIVVVGKRALKDLAVGSLDLREQPAIALSISMSLGVRRDRLISVFGLIHFTNSISPGRQVWLNQGSSGP